MDGIVWELVTGLHFYAKQDFAVMTCAVFGDSVFLTIFFPLSGTGTAFGHDWVMEMVRFLKEKALTLIPVGTNFADGPD